MTRVNGTSWFRARPLAVQLALVCALVTAMVAGTAFVILRVETAENVSDVFVQEVAATQTALGRLQARNQRLLLATSSFVSTNPSLRAAIGLVRTEANVAGSPQRAALLATIQAEVDRIYEELDHDLLVVTDDGGRVLAVRGGGRELRVGDDLSGVPVVRYALEAEAATADSSFGVFRGESGPLQVSSVAILVSGYPIGALLLGDRLDRLMPAPDAKLGTQAIVSAGDVVLASTVPEAPVGSRWDASAGSVGDSVWSVTLNGNEFVAATLPLGFTEENRPAGLHLVRSLSASLAPVERSLSTSFLLAGVLAVLLVGLASAIMSRATLRPLSRFVAFMRAGAGAEDHARFDYARFDDPHPAAEIGALTDAYNRLIESLRDHNAQLQERSVELAIAVETLREEVGAHERTESALRQSEEQLRQSQKLESLGTLAGGVAHDFNNLLAVILGYAALSAADAPPGSRERDDLEQIKSAAERAAELVKQLLAFSRKQVLLPQIVDLNRIVSGMESLLRPLIGEDVQVVTRLAPDLERIHADPGQLEQVIVNLVVNARDAMPTGGEITIETANAYVDEHGEPVPPGKTVKPMVMLAVRDTGTGMDAATRERIFEPFYTTKAPGKGTGLGLSTVYGIVRQSGGIITVETAPKEGCTLRCYFPATIEATVQAAPQDARADVSRGSETILVAEDEPQLRALITRTLTERGYRVLDAGNGQEAIEVAAAHDGSIHLLITDVVMPVLSGSDLAARLQEVRPGLRVIFVSGYSDDAIDRHGVLAPDSVFLQKPVMPEELARATREILDAPFATPASA
jgi:signal transduction histidine kinase/ActR/RegA family two-component response regulator